MIVILGAVWSHCGYRADIQFPLSSQSSGGKCAGFYKFSIYLCEGIKNERGGGNNTKEKSYRNVARYGDGKWTSGSICWELRIKMNLMC